MSERGSRLAKSSQTPGAAPQGAAHETPSVKSIHRSSGLVNPIGPLNIRGPAGLFRAAYNLDEPVPVRPESSFAESNRAPNPSIY
jgi:hypothetical protein